ncbi:hypothetical protein TrispH2_010988 [Trichoplax sp. H2]|nr:hypothetical protein TrispH2_010988 [Trichoplax sp. H2]|eukprot:RDD36729.1 hypothetical protein TrispH2_010988 [Trichoplax sp. H2]
MPSKKPGRLPHCDVVPVRPRSAVDESQCILGQSQAVNEATRRYERAHTLATQSATRVVVVRASQNTSMQSI